MNNIRLLEYVSEMIFINKLRGTIHIFIIKMIIKHVIDSWQVAGNPRSTAHYELAVKVIIKFNPLKR